MIALYTIHEKRLLGSKIVKGVCCIKWCGYVDGGGQASRACSCWRAYDMGARTCGKETAQVIYCMMCYICHSIYTQACGPWIYGIGGFIVYCAMNYIL